MRIILFLAGLLIGTSVFARDLNIGCRLDYYLCADKTCQDVNRETIACDVRSFPEKQYVSFPVKFDQLPVSASADIGTSNSAAAAYYANMKLKIENFPSARNGGGFSLDQTAMLVFDVSDTANIKYKNSYIESAVFHCGEVKTNFAGCN